MRVKVIVEMDSARGTIPVGRILEIPASLLEKLAGKIEMITQNVVVLSTPVLEYKDNRYTINPVGSIRSGIVYSSPPRCFWCKSLDLWKTTQGGIICRRCHPPAQGAEAAEGNGHCSRNFSAPRTLSITDNGDG